jgi:hypothetical protein
MKNKKIITLIFSFLILGFSIATIYFMGQSKKYESQTQTLRDYQIRIQQEREALQNKVLTAPASCANVSAGIFSRVCENEVYETEEVIPWATGISDAARNCLAESYFSKMELFAKKSGRSFEKSNHDEDWMFISHACDVNGDFMLFIDDFALDDADVDADQALDLWYQYDADEYCRKSKEHSWCND